jgi:mannose-6-phosphate isomerase
MEQPLYPFTFEPIFKDRIWGGTRLKDYLHKSISSNKTGESWEISTVPNAVSIISNGIYQGKNLNELIEQFPEAILGKEVVKRFGTQFPLLFKYLDANQDLSIQLHPNDALAKKRHNSFGKTEMWYVMQADAGARLIIGFKEDTNRETYIKQLHENKLLPLLNEIPVQKGDVFLLETGTIHAIGAGILIAEIQQTSDITYRLYDWDRVDEQGNKRELHTELALDAINFKKTPTQKEYQSKSNESVEIVNCPFFRTELISLESELIIENSGDSFFVLMCTEGNFSIEYNKTTVDFNIGQTILLPANLRSIRLIGLATILKILI